MLYYSLKQSKLSISYKQNPTTKERLEKTKCEGCKFLQGDIYHQINKIYNTINMEIFDLRNSPIIEDVPLSLENVYIFYLIHYF